MVNLLRKLFVVIALLVSAAFAQTSVQPFVAGGGILLGSGYVPAGGAGVGGLLLTNKYFLLDPEVGYETGGKADDNANVSSAGHTRYMRGSAFVRVGKWYIGPGCSWSKLYTPDYTKSFVHPRFGIGRDFESHYVDRVVVQYVHPGTDTANAVQGFNVAGWWFFGRYAFLRMDLDADWAHNTVTAPGNASLTALQKSQHTTTAAFQTLIGFRF